MRQLLSVLSLSVLVWANPSHADTKTLQLQANNLVTLVINKAKPDAGALLERYLQGAFPLAQQNGMEVLQNFDVVRPIRGNETPEYAGLFRWPNEAAAQQTRQSPTYLTEFKPLRPHAWDELMAFDLPINKTTEIELNTDKVHTVAIIWLKSPEAFPKYLEATQTLRKQLQDKILLLNEVSSFDYLRTEKSLKKPDFVALVEWPDADAPKQYQASLASETYAEMVSEVFAHVEWFELKMRPE